MSHFTVLVIGENPEAQLAPYHEFECTGQDDQYVKDIDITDDYRAYYEGYCDDCAEKGNPAKSFGEYCTEDYTAWNTPYAPVPEECKYGYTVLDKNGEVKHVIKRTNPDKKWDWYSLGGRWTGFFRLKELATGAQGRPGLMTSPAKEGYADAALKGDIDFAIMRSEAEDAAAEKFNAVRAIIEPHLPVLSWADVREKYCPKQGEAQLPGGIDAARDAYHSQPAVMALREAKRWEDAEDYAGDRETFIRQSGIHSHMTFAVVKDGQWYEQGRMGWWGIVLDEKEDDVWTDEFAKLIDGLPDDTLLSVYDCHI